jgi:hypothetical protein
MPQQKSIPQRVRDWSKQQDEVVRSAPKRTVVGNVRELAQQGSRLARKAVRRRRSPRGDRR